LAARMKAEGLEAGVPDVLIFSRHDQYRGVAIEMKAKKGKVSDRQSEWHRKLSAEGWLVAVCYSSDEAIDVVRGLFVR